MRQYSPPCTTRTFGYAQLVTRIWLRASGYAHLVTCIWFHAVARKPRAATRSDTKHHPLYARSCPGELYGTWTWLPCRLVRRLCADVEIAIDGEVATVKGQFVRLRGGDGHPAASKAAEQQRIAAQSPPAARSPSATLTRQKVPRTAPPLLCCPRPPRPLRCSRAVTCMHAAAAFGAATLAIARIAPTARRGVSTQAIARLVPTAGSAHRPAFPLKPSHVGSCYHRRGLSPAHAALRLCRWRLARPCWPCRTPRHRIYT